MLFIFINIPFSIDTLIVNEDSGCGDRNSILFKQQKSKNWRNSSRGGADFKEINAIYWGTHSSLHVAFFCNQVGTRSPEALGCNL